MGHDMIEAEEYFMSNFIIWKKEKMNEELCY